MVTTRKTKLKGVARLGAEAKEAAKKPTAVGAETNKAGYGLGFSSIFGTVKEEEDEEEVDEAAVAAARAEVESRIVAKIEAEAKSVVDKTLAATATAAVATAKALAAAATAKAAPSENDDNDSTVDVYVEPALEESTSITTDENISSTTNI